MSSFLFLKNSQTGEFAWTLTENDDDHIVDRSTYADMLHDTERNGKYEEAVRLAIESIKSSGRKALVLNIGTGIAGLLAMMAARHGADSVIACEACTSMAECARQVIRDNGFEEKIHIISKLSTELKVAPDGDLKELCNILVAEVFDTQLIAEGGISTIRHALDELLVKDCIVIPSSAVVYAQVVQSSHLRKWNSFEPICFSVKRENSEEMEEVRISPPARIRSCPGQVTAHDLQLDQLSQDLFQPITQSVELFRFDFMRREPLEFNRECRMKLISLRDGHCDAVFSWWVVQMDVSGQIELRVGPRWHHPTPDNMQWRYHWRQAVYYPFTRLHVRTNQPFELVSNHDEYSWWFNVAEISVISSDEPLSLPDRTTKKIEQPDRRGCVCFGHIACDRTRIAMLNDSSRNESYIQLLKKVVTNDTVCLCLGDESLLPFIVEKLGAAKVYSIQTNPLSCSLVQSYRRANQSRVRILQKSVDELNSDDISDNKITLVIAEPFLFLTKLYRPNIIHCLYNREELQCMLTPACTILPARAIVKAIAVSFKDLHKIRADLPTCEGFNLKALDRTTENSCEIAQVEIELHPLWQYPADPLSDVIDILSIDFLKPLNDAKTVEHEGTIQFTGSGRCNGVALWMEYQLEDNATNGASISAGLLAPPEFGKPLKWDPYTLQAVLFCRDATSVVQGEQNQLKHRVVFEFSSGEFDFDFSIEKQ